MNQRDAPDVTRFQEQGGQKRAQDAGLQGFERAWAMSKPVTTWPFMMDGVTWTKPKISDETITLRSDLDASRRNEPAAR